MRRFGRKRDVSIQSGHSLYRRGESSPGIARAVVDLRRAAEVIGEMQDLGILNLLDQEKISDQLLEDAYWLEGLITIDYRE